MTTGLTLTIAERIAEVAARHGLTPADLTGPSQRRPLIGPRHEAMWEIRQVKRADGSHRYSLPMIGSRFGGRHWASVLYAVRKHEALVNGEPIEQAA